MFRFTQYQRMLSTLAQCEFSLGKTLMVYDMNLREMENYEKIYTNIGNKSLCPSTVATDTQIKLFLNFLMCYTLKFVHVDRVCFKLQNRILHQLMKR